MMIYLVAIYLIGAAIGIGIALSSDEQGTFGGIPALLGVVVSLFWPIALPILAVIALLGFLKGNGDDR